MENYNTILEEVKKNAPCYVDDEFEASEITRLTSLAYSKAIAVDFAKWLRENTVENDGLWLMRVEDTFTDEEIFEEYLKSTSKVQ